MTTGARILSMVVLLGCKRGPVMPPAGTADQSVRDAVVLVCAAPERAAPEIDKGVGASDAISLHLTDGIGNDRVLTTVEAWKTDGINARELDALIAEAKVESCALRDTVGAH